MRLTPLGIVILGPDRRDLAFVGVPHARPAHQVLRTFSAWRAPLVVGGSSALGYPYSPMLSIGQIVGWQIEQALPETRVYVDIGANLGRNLEDQHQGLSAVKRRPDVVIVDSGHNEFLSRFDGSRDAGYAEAPAGPLLLGAYRLSLHSPLCRWIYETVRRHRLGGPPPLVNKHHLIDVPMFTPSEYFQIVTDLAPARGHHQLLRADRRRGDSGHSTGQRIGVRAQSSNPLPDRLSTQRKSSYRALCRPGRSSPTAPEESMKQYRSLLAEQPDFAEIHFRLGRLLDKAGAYDEAHAHYIRARDLDGFPVRCRTEFAQIYRDVAARHDCILIDGPEFLRRMSRHGIVDDELIHDAHHPTFAGHLGLAQAIMNELYSRKALGLGRNRRPCACHRSGRLPAVF